MTLDELAEALFTGGHALEQDDLGVVAGNATSGNGVELRVVGIVGGRPLGVDAAIRLSRIVLEHVAGGNGAPLLMLVDTQSQKMARRDELLGLNEYLAHLSKSLALASLEGVRTIGLLYGGAAAGAFIATALSTERLVAVPGAEPSVMDLPSIARVTKLPLERLKEMAGTTPIFAPGLDHLAATGAVAECWDADRSGYAARLDALLSEGGEVADRRDELGAERKGRLRAAEIARRVRGEASGRARS
ncbi:biotin-independent malonate decarboxylase subunit gamma [Rhizosaccharibacter radicis]|uniref:Biotin-independent malonate decarboxylase subunit gamma n=1 Tax=Rhizosaccharibacter radicis TaxID=2782605 RepID=A0ABT1W1I8_9PROT|nr:biotin-independent malonate decarboxylase subunit gamma [Acetobacteraceae bacterium KSS12]